MSPSLTTGVRLLEAGRAADAARVLEPLAGASRSGVIARFRQAEALSRLGRHDEACEVARQAVAESGDASPAPLWLAWTLAEAGRHEEAAAVPLPATSVESLDHVRAGFAALARIAADDRTAPEDDVRAVLETHHAPIYSLALRLAEAWRVARTPRGPDLPSTWDRIDCRLEMEDDGQTTHPPAPPAPRGGEAARRATRWVQLHCACGDHGELVAAIRALRNPPEDIDEAELEMLLALGHLDAAEELTERLAAAAGDDASGVLALCRARLGQLQGRPAVVDDFAGHDDARKLLPQMAAWLDMTAALLRGDPRAARSPADRVADPARREFVEAALRRWAG